MTQAEIIRWAISGIKLKRIALHTGYNELRDTVPIAAERLLEELRNLNEKQGELERMLEETREEESNV